MVYYVSFTGIKLISKIKKYILKMGKIYIKTCKKINNFKK
jgi:hypothetical protein